MGYLIPKSARNVKMQLFKGLGIVEAVMVVAAAIIAVLIFQTSWSMVVKIAVIAKKDTKVLMLCFLICHKKSIIKREV